MKGKKIIITALLLTAANCVANAQLIINELMQSNIECIMDDIHEFPDSWVELYNSGDEAVNLQDYKISNKNKEKKAWQLPAKTIAAKGFIIIYCDKEGKEDNRLHVDFRLESGKGCTVYLFKDKEIVDSLPYVDEKPLVKMPAPDVAFGRKTDGSDEWGYQLTPTPGKANTGEICNAKHILGAPVFSEPGRVTSGNAAINLELSLPEDAPEGAFITYTTNGSEPKASDTRYSQPISITNTKVIRAKVFCDGWLSPLSTAQSYIFHPRAMTIPIFSIQTNDDYLNGGNYMGLFRYNNSKEDKKTHDWRRPVNVEFFPVEGEPSAFNIPGETRIQGGQSRSNALKSMVFYANKRFDPDKKRFSYEFFPDQKPGITEFKSFSLRDGGNDFSDMYFRDLIIQRTMGPNADLDWQAGHSAVLYINGEYMGMLNIRERSNEDNIYSNYDGLEDLDEIEIAHEQQGNQDLFIEELKEGSADNYEAFKEFYSEKGHTKTEYEQWLDVSEYLNVMILNLFYCNVDFPGNNLVFWRPNEDAKVDLPKRWRVIVKDTDFGLGLYGWSETKSTSNTIDMIYNPRKYSNSWAFSEVATRLFRNMMEDPDIQQMFIDKSCVYMGDFLNAEGTGAVMDAILDEALEEFVAHRDKYNPGWGGQSNNRQDILNKFDNAKKWLTGYTEQTGGWGGGWWGGGGQQQTTTYLPRTDYFLQYMSAQYQLGDAIPVTINKGTEELPDELFINDIKLTKGVFDGKLFVNRQITLEGKTTGDMEVTGWDIEKTASNGTVTTEHVDGAIYTFNMPACKNLVINAVLNNGTGITNPVANSDASRNWKWYVSNNTLNVSGVAAGTDVTLYNLQGMQLKQIKSDGSVIQLPLTNNQVYILKVGKETIKVK